MIFQPVVLAAIERDGKFLLTLRNNPTGKLSMFHNKWQLPGGKVEFKESVEETLKRELKEELGVTLIEYKLIPSIYHSVRGGYHFLFISFLCHIKEDAKITLNEEATEFKWVSLSEIKLIDYLPHTYEVIQDALK